MARRRRNQHSGERHTCQYNGGYDVGVKLDQKTLGHDQPRGRGASRGKTIIIAPVFPSPPWLIMSQCFWELVEERAPELLRSARLSLDFDRLPRENRQARPRYVNLRNVRWPIKLIFWGEVSECVLRVNFTDQPIRSVEHKFTDHCGAPIFAPTLGGQRLQVFSRAFHLFDILFELARAFDRVWRRTTLKDPLGCFGRERHARPACYCCPGFALPGGKLPD
jgi:hypothetical protein